MISAMYELPDDYFHNARNLATAAYLEACHMLFEEGILSHKTIHLSNQDVLKNMEKGFKFFEEWYQELAASGKLMQFNATSCIFILLCGTRL